MKLLILEKGRSWEKMPCTCPNYCNLCQPHPGCGMECHDVKCSALCSPVQTPK